MSRKRKIAILVHENERITRPIEYIVWQLAEEWKAQGIEIEIVHGVSKIVDADLLFPQINLSIIPEEYLNYYQHFQYVINKTCGIFENLLTVSTEYS